jgi:hypothetical protein
MALCCCALPTALNTTNVGETSLAADTSRFPASARDSETPPVRVSDVLASGTVEAWLAWVAAQSLRPEEVKANYGARTVATLSLERAEFCGVSARDGEEASP